MMPYGTNNIVTIAGSAALAAGVADGNGVLATFSRPFNVATDSANNVYVADATITVFAE